MRIGIGTWAALATAALHGGLALSVASIRVAAPRPPTVIELREAKPRPTPPSPKSVEPPPPKAIATPAPKPAAAKPAPPRASKPARAPAPAASAPAASAAPPTYNLKLGNAGGNGPAVAPPAEPAPPPSAPVHKELHAASAPATDACEEPIVKPKPVHVVQPAFTADAQEAGVTGKVRVEISISATGEITDARVIEGLGHGLDEAALEAARASTFSPATQCGAPVATTFTIGMRFTR